MKRLVTIIFYITIVSKCCFSQSYSNSNKEQFKNSIHFYFTPCLSKTNLERSDVEPRSDFRRTVRLENLTNPVYGFRVGFIQSRKIGNRVNIGIGIGVEKKGEVSNPIEPVTPGSLLYDSVHYFYRFDLLTYQFPLEIGFQVFENNKFSCNIGVNLIADVHVRYKGKVYFEYNESGERRDVSTLKEEYGFNEKQIQGFVKNLGKGHFRIGTGVFSEFRYSFNQFFYSGIGLKVILYSDLINKEERMLNGEGFVVGLNISTGMNF